MSDEELLQARSWIEQALPPWLGAWGIKLLYPFGIILDELREGGVRLLQLSLPNYYDGSSLKELAKDRKIYRVDSETDEQFAARLAGWYQAHQTEGNPWSLLDQLARYLRPSTLKLEIIHDAGLRFVLNSDGTKSVFQTSWNWGATGPSRYWIVIHAAGRWLNDDTWADLGQVDDPLFGIGSQATMFEIKAIQAIVNNFTPPHAKCEKIVIVFDDSSWDPQQPDGHWDLNSHRNHNVEYWSTSQWLGA